MGIKISKDHLHPSVIESITSLIGDLSQLETTAKGNAVEAINELLANSGNKEELEALIAEINDMKSDLKQVLTDEGIEVTDDDMASLITKTDNEFENIQNLLIELITNNGHKVYSDEYDIKSLINKIDYEGLLLGLKSTKIASGANHFFVLTSDGALWACGDNTSGQLGLGDTTNRTTFTQVITNVDEIDQIICKNNISFIIKKDGSLWACGLNDKGQLGLGDTTNINTFTKVTTNINGIKQLCVDSSSSFIIDSDNNLWGTGDMSSQFSSMGSKTNFTRIDSELTNNIKQIALQGNTVYILKNDGTLWGYGGNWSGQLGLGHFNDVSTPTQLNTDVKYVAFGGTGSAFIVKNDGTCYDAGYNYQGQLGIGNNTVRDPNWNLLPMTDVVYVGFGECHTVAINSDGTVYVAGANQYGQTGVGDTTTFIAINGTTRNKEMCIGTNRTFILKTNGTFWGTGIGLNANGTGNSNSNGYIQFKFGPQPSF